MKPLTFTNDNGDFTICQPESISSLYFPLASEAGLKSAISPNLGGDAKINQEHFLLEPVSVDNLHNNRSTRNFWVKTTDGKFASITGTSASQEAQKFSETQEKSRIHAGFMWHQLERELSDLNLKATTTSFVPTNETFEFMLVSITNTATTPQELTATAAIPIFGRSADNLRDHRNVTSMLHRIRTDKAGIYVTPTMSFDERGHRLNHQTYYVMGFDDVGNTSKTFFPTVESFIGEGGSFTHPRSLFENETGVTAGYTCDGREAMGAFRFETFSVAPNETKNFILLLGISDGEQTIDRIKNTYNSLEIVQTALKETKTYWQDKVSVNFKTADTDFNRFMKWVCFQPYLRRIFGCSFLPHHDYGRGGRGWRDLWQDCLSLLLMEPKDVGEMIVNNFKGVRLDGTNATIIGAGEGNFLADRNGISRVWMDHALWPLMTTKLYIDQTGDISILNKQVSYFKDPHIKRGTAFDSLWNDEYGNQQRTTTDDIYTGSILEHLLIQHLTGFYEVGQHNIYRLRGADWNDALDMANEYGESVAFTAAYSGNLMELAALIRLLENKTGVESVEILEEIGLLLKKDTEIYNQIDRKHQILDVYTKNCQHNINGNKIKISLSEIALNLIQKANWLRHFLQENEWIDINNEEGWYNSYYDNSGNATDGYYNGIQHMMLTGQVFSIMNYVATDLQIKKITKSADRYLYRKEIGGYRLNTDFQEVKGNLGRMFGFAYGEKENGAVFSHMAVMYANALYRRGFAKEGWKALKSLADTSLDFKTSHIYPGIPEYFRADGRGVYHYLTGAASWYMLTMVTEVFGVHGKAGDLIIYPKLLSEQFDNNGIASIITQFAGKSLEVTYSNPEHKDFGHYVITSATCDGKVLPITDDAFVSVSKENLQSLDNSLHHITITLQ
ncbi:GH36-type glycosyl hydrolase domain-containing protein [Streptococcus sp. S784/96/1]|uniref:GH36-type glycosyl hydrolase domain-containing protein n=1 Tax=Streptococcus sp. S784/96/1 TaxID=2653499 RepID=UPI001389AC95|nr:cellobiose phosphorylase [Streptococcus sp. S784/96/1]